jgi:hypothetical protein
MKEIKLPVGGIVVNLTGDGGGSITSNMKMPCTHCAQTDCNNDCDGSQGADDEHPSDDNRTRFNAAIDGVESLILALACAGVDIEAPEVIEAIQTSEQTIAQHFPEE